MSSIINNPVQNPSIDPNQSPIWADFLARFLSQVEAARAAQDLEALYSLRYDALETRYLTNLFNRITATIREVEAKLDIDDSTPGERYLLKEVNRLARDAGRKEWDFLPDHWLDHFEPAYLASAKSGLASAWRLYEQRLTEKASRKDQLQALRIVDILIAEKREVEARWNDEREAILTRADDLTRYGIEDDPEWRPLTPSEREWTIKTLAAYFGGPDHVPQQVETRTVLPLGKAILELQAREAQKPENNDHVESEPK